MSTPSTPEDGATITMSRDDWRELRDFVHRNLWGVPSPACGRFLDRVQEALAAAPRPSDYIAVDGLGQKFVVPGNVTFEPWRDEDDDEASAAMAQAEEADDA